MSTSEPAGARPELDGLRARDEETLRGVWARERPRLRALAALVLGPGPAADDLADEVLVEVLFYRVQNLRHDAALSSYLRLAVTRRAVRARKRRALEVSDARLAEQGAPGPDEHAVTADLLRRLPACLKALTPKAQDALRLRHQADLTQEAIGALIGGSKQYIGRLLKQSQRALRACLEGGAA